MKWSNMYLEYSKIHLGKYNVKNVIKLNKIQLNKREKSNIK